jgi:hypothetical protein
MVGLYPDTFLYLIILNSLTRKVKADREVKENINKAEADKKKAEKEKAKIKGGVISIPLGKIKYPWITYILLDG